MAGFDATANHIDLVLIPVLLDLFLWFGPHLRIKQLTDTLIALATRQSGDFASQNADLLQAGSLFWQEITENLNIFSSLRSFPIGVPSLMVSSQPITNPLGQPAFWEVGSIWLLILIWLSLSLVGLAVGTLYFSAVSQAVTTSKVSWREVFSGWRWEVLQVILMSLTWIILVVAISIPASCLISGLVMSALPFSEFAIFIFGGLMLWILFPLLFTPHSIFVNRSRVGVALRDSMRLVRITMPRTALFFLSIFLLDEGFTLLWRVPESESWLAFIGVIGHAFVATGLVAASFSYYKEAHRWAQRLLQQAQLSSRA